MTEPEESTPADPLAPLIAAGIVSEPDEALAELSENQAPVAPDLPYGKIRGVPVDDTQVDAWADEAEAGYDLGIAPNED